MNSIRLITSIVIIAFLCQNISWAKGPTMLTPDNKRILSGIVELLGLDPSEGWGVFSNPSLIQERVDRLTPQERDRLTGFLQDNNLPENVRLIFARLLQSKNEALGITIGDDRERSHRIIKDAFTTKRHFEAVDARELPEFRELIDKAVGYLEGQGDTESQQKARDIRETRYFAIVAKGVELNHQPLFMWVNNDNQFQIGHPGTGIRHRERISYLTYGFLHLMNEKIKAKGNIMPVASVLAYEARIAREKLSERQSEGKGLLDRMLGRKPDAPASEDDLEAQAPLIKARNTEAIGLFDLIKEAYGVDIIDDWTEFGSLEQCVISEYGDVDKEKWTFPEELEETLKYGEFCIATNDVLEELRNLNFGTKAIPLPHLARLLARGISDDILREKAYSYIKRFLFRLPDNGVELFMRGLERLQAKDTRYMFILGNRCPINGQYRYRDPAQPGAEIPVSYFPVDWLIYGAERPELLWGRFRQYSFKDFVTVTIDKKIKDLTEEEVRDIHSRSEVLKGLWDINGIDAVEIKVELYKKKRKPVYYFRERENTLTITYYVGPGENTSELLEREIIDRYVKIRIDTETKGLNIIFKDNAYRDLVMPIMQISRRFGEYQDLLRRATEYVLRGEIPQAERILENLEANYPNDLRHYIPLLSIYTRRNQFDKVLELFSRLKDKRALRTLRPGMQMMLQALLGMGAEAIKRTEVEAGDIMGKEITLRRILEIKELFEEALAYSPETPALLPTLERSLQEVIGKIVNMLMDSRDIDRIERSVLYLERYELWYSVNFGGYGSSLRKGLIKGEILKLIKALISKGRKETYDLAERYLKRGFLLFGESDRDLQLCGLELALFKKDPESVERYMEGLKLEDNYFKGRLYLIRGDLRRAIRSFRVMKKGDDSFEISRFWLGVCLYELSKIETAGRSTLLNEARENLDYAVKHISMDSVYYPFIFYYLGLVQYELGNLGESCAYLRWAQDSYEEGETPDDFGYGINELLPAIEREIGRVDIFDEFSIKPPNWEILVLNRYNRLVLQNVLSIYSGEKPWKVLKELARCLFVLGKDDLILSYLKDIPDEALSIDAFIALGVTYGKLGQREECEALVKRFLAINRETLETRLALGRVYTELGDFEKGRTYYYQVLEEDNTNFDARAGLVRSYCYLTRFDMADSELGKIDEKDRKRLESLREMVNKTKLIYRELSARLQEDPAGTYIQILRYFSYHKEANFYVGEMFFGKGDYTGALEAFRRVGVADSLDPEPFYRMALCYRKLGEKEKEGIHLRIAFDKGHKTAGEEFGAILLMEGKYAEARDVYTRLNDNIGIAKTDLGLREFQNAISICDALLTEEPGNADAVSVKTAALLGLRKYREAKGLLDAHQGLEIPDSESLRARLMEGLELEKRSRNIVSLTARIELKISRLNRINKREYLQKADGEINPLLTELEKLDRTEYERLRIKREEVKRNTMRRIDRRDKRLREKEKILEDITSVKNDIKKMYRLEGNVEELDADRLARIVQIFERGIKKCDELARNITAINTTVRNSGFHLSLVIHIEIADTSRIITEKRKELEEGLRIVKQELFRKTIYRDFVTGIEARISNLRTIFKLDEERQALLTACRDFKERYKKEYPVVSLWIDGLLIRIEDSYQIARYRRDERKMEAMDKEVEVLLRKYEDRYKIDKTDSSKEFERELGEILDYYGQTIRYEFNRQEKERDARRRLGEIISRIDEEFRRRQEERQTAIRRDVELIRQRIKAHWQERFGTQGKIHNKLTLEMIDREEINHAGECILKNMKEGDLGIAEYISLRQELMGTIGKRMKQVDTLRLVRALIVIPKPLQDKLREEAAAVLEDKKRLLSRDETVSAKGRYRKLTGKELISLVRLAKLGNEAAEQFIIDSYDREIFYAIRKVASERVSFRGGEELVQASSWLSDNVAEYFRYGCDLVSIAVGNTQEDKDPEKIDNYIKKWLQFGMLTILREEVRDGLTGSEHSKMRRAARAAAMLGEGASTAEIAETAGVNPEVVEEAQQLGQLGMTHLDRAAFGEEAGEAIGERKYGHEDPGFVVLEDTQAREKAREQLEILLQGILTDEQWEWEEENGSLDGWNEALDRKRFIWNLFNEHVGWNEEGKGWELEELFEDSNFGPELERRGIDLENLKAEFLKIRLYLYISGNFIDYGFDINEIRAYPEEALCSIYQYLQDEDAQIWISAYELVRILISRTRVKTSELADRVFSAYMEKLGKDLGLEEILDELKGEIESNYPESELPAQHHSFVLFGLSPALISMLGFAAALLWTEYGGWWRFRKEVVEYVRLLLHAPPRQTSESRRRFLRSTAISTLLLACGVRPLLQKPSPVELPTFIEPKRELTPLEKELIEELKLLALDIKDPLSRRYAINFVNRFIRNGYLAVTIDDEIESHMFGIVASYDSIEDKVNINYRIFVERILINKILVKGNMVHEGRHIEDTLCHDKVSEKLPSIMRAYEYVLKRAKDGSMQDALYNSDNTWKKFTDVNFYTYWLLLLDMYRTTQVEVSARIAVYNFYLSELGDIRKILEGFEYNRDIEEFERQKEKNWLECRGYKISGDYKRYQQECFEEGKRKGIIPPRLSWDEYKEYSFKRQLNIFMELSFSKAIMPDNTINEGQVRRNFATIELPQESLIGRRGHYLLDVALEAEKRRGTIKFTEEGEYSVLNPDRFLDWLDTGIFVDENGNTIDLMKLDFTPDTHGVLPKLIPPFVIGTTQGSLDKEAIESLMLFVSQKYVEGKEQDEESRRAIEYLRSLGKGGYLDELHRVFTGLRKTAKLVQERYPFDKCWDTASVRDMTKGMGWVKELFADAPMLELECRTDRFECTHSVFVRDWLEVEGIKTRSWLVDIPKRYLNGEFRAEDGKAGHVVNLIEIDDPSPTDRLSPIRIVMGITPLDRLYGLYPYGVINHTDYETHIINEGSEISPQREEILRQRLDCPFVHLVLNGYEEHDPRYPTFSTIVVIVHEDTYGIFARSALYKLEGIVGMELPAGAIAIMISKDKLQMAAKEVEKFLQEDPELLSLSGKELDILKRWHANGWLRFAGGHYREGLTPEIKDAIDEGLKTALQDVFRIIYKLANLKEGVITVGRTSMVEKIYPDLVERIKDICPGWRPISIEDLCNIMTTGRIPLDWPGLVSAMRADGIIDEADFMLIIAIGEAVDKAAEGVGLTVNDKALLTEVIAIRYLLENAGELRNRLNSLGYGSVADRIILLLRGIKKGNSRHRTDYDFIKGLEKLTGYKLDDSGLNLADIRGNGENHLTRHWLGIFELNLKQWGVLELVDKKKPKGIIVQHIRDLGPGVQNWLEGIKRYNIDMSGVKMAYVTDGISDADMERLIQLKPSNVLLVQGIKELRGQGENIVYLASREKLEPYKGHSLRLVERGHAGPAIELNWCLLMLATDDIGSAYKQFVDKLVSSGLITKEQIQELEDPFYIRLPKAEKVLEMWDELHEGTSYLNIWA